LKDSIFDLPEKLKARWRMAERAFISFLKNESLTESIRYARRYRADRQAMASTAAGKSAIMLTAWRGRSGYRRYSIYSVKDGGEDECRGISELGGQEPTP
jgi:hypothetical protein